MPRSTRQAPGRAYFGIGIYQAKYFENVGVLWRGAYQLGAAFIFTVGKRYQPQPTDVHQTWTRIPLFTYRTWAEMVDGLPYGCRLIGVETGGDPLPTFDHPAQGAYILGAEDGGLPLELRARCHHVISIPSIRDASYNVAQAGTLVLYDRMVKRAMTGGTPNGSSDGDAGDLMDGSHE